MSADAIRDQAPLDDSAGPSDKKIALYRSYLSNCVLSQGLHALFQRQPFEGLSWGYFLADVELEARAGRIKEPRNWSAEAISNTIKALPPTGIGRLMAGYIAYFTPPENEALVDSRLQGMDAATVTRMRQRRHAVHAAETIESKQEEARKAAAEQEAALESQWWPCPHAELSSEPEDFLRWIKVQTPDTWHVIVQGWDHNCDDRDDVVEWILDQPTCDLGTAAQYFFTAAIGLADEDPAKLSSGYRRKWHLMKRVADNWQHGLYVRNELQHRVEPSDVRYYDDLVARREAGGRPLPWTVPGPKARRFDSRLPDSVYCYEPGHLRLTLAVWKRHRERSGCGKDFPRCCQV